MSDERIPLAGVIGSPVSHSLSPKVHGHWLARYGIPGHYVPIRLTHETFENGLRSLPTLGFRGVNVTLPFKEKALTLADVISDRAALIGAANTLTFQRNGRIHADNTDGVGFIANIRRNAPSWSPEDGPALILGAGGASRAVIAALVAEGAPAVVLANRTRGKADMLAEHFGARVKAVDWSTVEPRLKEVSMLVNTTSLGMTGQKDLALDLGGIRKGTLVTDLVYSPLRTTLLEMAERSGCVTVDGLGMLLHQAVPGFENWFHQKPVVDQALRDAVLSP